jgi:hypothetical protein
MKNKTLKPKQRKRLATLKREINEILALAYKLDGNDGYAFGDRINDRYESKQREINRIQLLNGSL